MTILSHPTTNRLRLLIEPCARCGRRGNVTGHKGGRPARHDGEPFGIDGAVCGPCREEMRAEETVPDDDEPTAAEWAGIFRRMLVASAAKRAGRSVRVDLMLFEMEPRRRTLPIARTAAQAAFDFGDDPGRGPGGRAA